MRSTVNTVNIVFSQNGITESIVFSQHSYIFLSSKLQNTAAPGDLAHTIGDSYMKIKTDDYGRTLDNTLIFSSTSSMSQ